MYLLFHKYLSHMWIFCTRSFNKFSFGYHILQFSNICQTVFVKSVLPTNNSRCYRDSSHPTIWPGKATAHYKKKSLIGRSLSGAVSFVSSLYSSNVSDKELFAQSGILEKRDSIMADRGFDVYDLLQCGAMWSIAMPLVVKMQKSHQFADVTANGTWTW